jgi:hypothetical protein
MARNTTIARFGISIYLALVVGCGPVRGDADGKGDAAVVAAVPDSSPVAAAGNVWTVDAMGIGPVRAGMTLNEARTAVSPGMTLPAPTEAECDFIRPVGGPPGIAFMVIEGMIARVDVRDSTIATADGARVGDPESRIRAMYGDRVVVQPHKYTDGRYLIVPKGPGPDTLYRIVFETDSAGRVTEYRSGRMPEVEYIEGCS